MASILVIDDSTFQRFLVSSLIKEEGHRPLQASDGKEGLGLIERERPDCVILDMLMPDITGLEVLEMVRAMGNDVPVIVYTANIQERVKKRCVSLGVSDVVYKKGDDSNLRIAVERVFARRGGFRDSLCLSA